MLALFAGTGGLPGHLARRLRETGQPHVICPLADEVAGEVPVTLERLGSTLANLRRRGVTEICLAGAIDRARLSMGAPDAATRPLVPALTDALGAGDGRAIALLLDLLESQGFVIRAAHQICPELLPAPGILTTAGPDDAARADADRALGVLKLTGLADIGQGCVVEAGQVLAIEALPGTAWMLEEVARFRRALGRGPGGVFAKAPKPGQDRRADLPLIGPETARQVVLAGLAGIVAEAGGVMVLEAARTAAILDEAGAFLWIRQG